MKKLRKLLFTTLVAALSFGIYAQEEINWLSLEEAIERNEKEPRKFIVDVYTDWCGWCKRMDVQTFSNPVIAEYISKHYYAVKFNAEHRENILIGDRQYKFVESGSRGYHEMAVILTRGRLSYPTLVYLDEELRHMDVVPGFVTALQLEPMLAYFNEGAYKHASFDEFKKEFSGKISSTE